MRTALGSPARRRSRVALPLALLLSLAVALPACDGDASGDDSGLTPGGLDVQEQRRDLSQFFVDGSIPETVGPPPGHYPDNATENQIKALERVNWYRHRVNLPPVDMSATINQAAQAHCDCYVEHVAEYDATGRTPHSEDPNWPAPCTGEWPWDRTSAAGLQGFRTSEIIAFTLNPISAVDGWVETLYHRLPITDPTSVACGYGEVTEGPSSINTMNFAHGMTVPNLAQIIIYPEDGAEEIPIKWDGYEDPQPPPPPNGYPSGPIITLTTSLRPFITVTHDMYSEDGTPIEHMYLDGTNDEHLKDTNTACIYPYVPLEPNTTYHVDFQLDIEGTATDVEWSFTTRAF